MDGGMSTPYVPLNLDKLECGDCGCHIGKGVMLANVELCKLSTDFVVLCNKCYKKWFIQQMHKWIKGDISILKELANMNDYIIKKVVR
jgi:hypothetical protein